MGGPIAPADQTNVAVRRDLASAPAQSGVYGRMLTSESVLPYAFVAASS
jgi:hypothetical protein